MPLIEELPIAKPTRVSHGWAYVPDVVQPIASMSQPNPRKRNRNDAGTTNATATAKQQKAVQQRLESLNRENWKDGVTIPIPARPGGKERKTKMAINVRRILGYHKTFTHYLADEEAAIAATGSSMSVLGPITSSTPIAAGSKVDGRRKASIMETTTMTATTPGRRRSNMNAEKEKMAPPPPPPPKPQSSIKISSSATNRVKEEDEEDIIMSDAPAVDSGQQPVPKPKPPYDPSYDANPLLKTLNLPKKPSDRVMQILVTEPPLPYAAARAKPLPEQDDYSHTGNLKHAISSVLKSKPPRHFCAICGYWGKVKCRKCGEWTCGIMECWKGHEGVCVALGMY